MGGGGDLRHDAPFPIKSTSRSNQCSRIELMKTSCQFYEQARGPDHIILRVYVCCILYRDSKSLPRQQRTSAKY